LGIFSFTQIGMDGAVYQMLSHGISTGALFMLLGMIYERRHTYDIAEDGGLAAAEWLYRRVHGAERRFPGEAALRHSGGNRRHLERVLSAVDVSTSLLRNHHQSSQQFVARSGRSRARLLVAAGDCGAGHGSCPHALAALD